MKYRQLTKEQFEALHEEFATFLATQSIDAKEWNQIKEAQPKVAEDEMNVFSDVVWDDVLTKTKYLEHFSKQSINLFKCDSTEIHRVFVKVNTDEDMCREYKEPVQKSNDEEEIKTSKTDDKNTFSGNEGNEDNRISFN